MESTNNKDYYEHSRNMQNDFLDRGFPKDLVADAVKKASMRKREELLNTKKKTGEGFKGITTAIDYTPLTPEIKHIIFQHWHIVKDIPGCSDKLRIGLWKTKSIKDIVTKSDIGAIQFNQPITTGHFWCGQCSCCHQAWIASDIALPSVNFVKHLIFFHHVTHRCVYICYNAIVGCVMLGPPDEN